MGRPDEYEKMHTTTVTIAKHDTISHDTHQRVCKKMRCGVRRMGKEARETYENVRVGVDGYGLLSMVLTQRCVTARHANKHQQNTTDDDE